MTKDMLSPSTQSSDALKRALVALKDLRAKVDAFERAKTEPIAIVGMACRFPGGADNPEMFWQLLQNGRDAIAEVPSDRFRIDDYYDPDPDAPGKTYARWGGFIQQVDHFDPQFFGISPKEAVSLDPQQRLLLEVSWEALEHAGISPEKLAASQTGVFVGLSSSEYSQLQIEALGFDHVDPYLGTGGMYSVAAGRLAFVLGLHGPTMTVDTACSSSLVTVHLACQSLRSHQADLALAGGANVILSPLPHVYLSRLKALAADGRCKAFDASADGFVRGEGCGMVALKRLSDALRDGDHIWAIIRGSAINHDGKSSGLTVPNGAAQQAVIRQALQDAGELDPIDVSYVEAHGTGTSLGDPIEVRALAAVMGPDRSKEQPLLIGSVKTNIGHLESAAGIASLIKVVLSLKNGEIPPSLHCVNPNPFIDWDNIPVRVVTERTPWAVGENPRLASVSAFGFSGTNAHMILEEAPATSVDAGAVSAIERPALLLLSARSETALQKLAGRFADMLAGPRPPTLPDVAYTLAVGRNLFQHRLALPAVDVLAAAHDLRSFATGELPMGALAGVVGRGQAPKVAFLFTGQGAQYTGMARRLYESEPVFQAELERCAALLAGLVDEPLMDVLYPQVGYSSPLDDTTYTQPALFAVEWALARMWMAWGVQPYAVLGHSVGELVAACLAGVFSLEDGLKLITARARRMGSLPVGGAMAAVFAPAQVVLPGLEAYGERLSVAAFNAPDNTVVSGDADALDEFLVEMAERGVNARRLNVSHAFHSARMNAILDAFETDAAEQVYAAPQLQLISNVTGEIAGAAIASPAYWRDHIRQPVQFVKGVNKLHEIGCQVFIEIGPNPTLISLAKRCLPEAEYLSWVPSLRSGRDDLEMLTAAQAELFVRGVSANYAAHLRQTNPHIVALPTYPFERQRYWVDEISKRRMPVAAPPAAQLHPLFGQRIASPLLQDRVYETHISVDQPAFLGHHRLMGVPFFPATGYVEIGMAAARLFGQAGMVVEDINLLKSLRLSEGEQKHLQVALSVDNGAVTGLRVFSLDNSDTDAWSLHMTGRFAGSTPPDGMSELQMQDAYSRKPDHISRSDFYQSFEKIWSEYGPSFRCVQQVGSDGEEALGYLALPAEHAHEASEYILHPGLLDSAIQLLANLIPAALRDDAHDSFFVPITIKRCYIVQPGLGRLWARARLEKTNSSDTLVGDLSLYDDTGAPAGYVQGLLLRRANLGLMTGIAPQDGYGQIYGVRWEPLPSPAKSLSAADKLSGSWLLVDVAGSGEIIADTLRLAGVSCNVYRPSMDVSDTSTQGWQMIEAACNELPHPSRGLIFWADARVDVPQTIEGIKAAQAEMLTGLLHSARALVALQSQGAVDRPSLVMVTRGAQAVEEGDEVTAIAQASLWGAGRSLALEHPELDCVFLDLDPHANLKMCADDLLTGLAALGDEEKQIARRAHRRFGLRLVRRAAGSETGISKEKISRTTPVQLQFTERGILDNLKLAPVDRPAPGPGQVLIRIQAAGLNFHDVLNVLNMLPWAENRLGYECAGVVAAVGEGVDRFALGDTVMGIVPGSFGTYALAQEDLVIRVPDVLNVIEAATIPMAFLTAYYTLVQLGHIKKGDKVLIHAAAGGVGLAAVQIALQAGATIFATAGSLKKREFLRSMGVHYLMDSRSLEFYDQIMEWTEGQGVDIVLNSLSGEALEKSFAALRPGGKFYEIGKLDIYTPGQVQQFGKEVEYCAFLLGDVCQREPALIQAMLQDLVSQLKDGAYRPLPINQFPLETAADAFRFMAQGRHIGKIVLTVADDSKPALFHPDASYLITGGLGGIGLKTAQWLAENGAKSIVLAGRSIPTEEQQTRIEEIQAAGAKVTYISADVSCERDVIHILTEIRSKLPALRGVFHTAGVLDDKTFQNLDWPSFERALAPKAWGAWNLHMHTLNLELDHFVLFSAGASIFGASGQANYAAANAFLDSLAHLRHSIGRPGLSVNWGPWAEVGMAAHTPKAHVERWARQGIRMLSPRECLNALEILLDANLAQAGVFAIQWRDFLAGYPQGRRKAFFEEFVKGLPAGERQPQYLLTEISPVQELLDTPPAGRVHLLQRQVAVIIAQVIGARNPDQIQLGQSLIELGIDSLMLVELRNRLRVAYTVDVPLDALFSFPTLADLYSYLSSLILASEKFKGEATARVSDREEFEV